MCKWCVEQRNKRKPFIGKVTITRYVKRPLIQVINPETIKEK